MYIIYDEHRIVYSILYYYTKYKTYNNYYNYYNNNIIFNILL